MAQGQGDLLVRAVRGAPAVWGVEEWGGGGWVRQQQRATAARPLGIAAVRLRIRHHLLFLKLNQSTTTPFSLALSPQQPFN